MPPFRPNYSQQRGDRSRTKDGRKQERLEKRREASEIRRAARADDVAKTDCEPQPAPPVETSEHN